MTRKHYLALSHALDAARYPTAGMADEERTAYLQGVKMAAYSVATALRAQSSAFDFDQFMTDAGFPGTTRIT